MNIESQYVLCMTARIRVKGIYCPNQHQPIPVLPACPGDNKQTNQVSQIMPNHFGSVILQSSSEQYVPLLYFFLCPRHCTLSVNGPPHQVSFLLVTGICIGQTSLMSRSPSCTSSNLISLSLLYLLLLLLLLFYYFPPVTSNFLHPSWSILHHFAASCKLNPNSFLSLSLSLFFSFSHTLSVLYLLPTNSINPSFCWLFVLIQDPPGIPIFFNSSSFLSWVTESWSATR